MIALITFLIVIACIVLGFFILIQNPKGGGLSGTFGNISSQVMGVKQSGDVMEKGTWATMGIIAAFCLICVMFYPKLEKSSNTPAKQQTQQPASKK